ncbi:MAG: DUF1194 domain-containing protein, partial [Pseudooceanicola atlanticus]
MTRPMVRGAISALCLTLWPLAAGAECRLALLLALDVSASVDETEYKLQRDGLAAALNRPLIRRAILEGADLQAQIRTFIDDVVTGYVTGATQEQEWEIEQLATALR